MRVLFIGDLQINDTQKEYMERLDLTIDWVISLIEKHRPEYVVTLGDVLDTGGWVSVPALLHAYEIMERITDTVPTHLILSGNHDVSDKDAKCSSVRVYPGVPCYQLDLIDGIAIFPYTRDYERVAEFLTRLEAEPPLLMVGHLDWKGVSLTPTFVSTKGLLPSDYSALFPGVPFVNGHYHSPLTVGEVVFAGSPLFRDFGDDPSRERGIFMWDSDQGFQFFPNPHTYYVAVVRGEGALASLQEIPSPENTKVRVHCSLSEVPEVEKLRSSFLWMGVFPEERVPVVSADLGVQVSLTTPPEEVVERVVSVASPEEYRVETLRDIGLECFGLGE